MVASSLGTVILTISSYTRLRCNPRHVCTCIYDCALGISLFRLGIIVPGGRQVQKDTAKSCSTDNKLGLVQQHSQTSLVLGDEKIFEKCRSWKEAHGLEMLGPRCRTACQARYSITNFAGPPVSKNSCRRTACDGREAAIGK